MRLALTSGDDGLVRAEASPGARGLCDLCWHPVLAKCGALVEWHWAHISNQDCDEWSEPDSGWHRGWQNLFPGNRREVVIGRHRADVVTPDGLVVELQHSSLSTYEIAERETFYGRMVWVFDAAEAYESDRLNIRRPAGKTYQTFRWKHPRKSIAACRRPAFLDLGDGRVFKLGKIHSASPCGGWGTLLPTAELVEALGGTAVPSGTAVVPGTTRAGGGGGGTRRFIGGYQYHRSGPAPRTPISPVVSDTTGGLR